MQSSAAYLDVMPELGRLRVKAAGKVRDHLMSNIYALRRPKTNIQILQQSLLLKHRGLLPFLRQHGPEVFGEVRAAYVETLSRVLSSHFKAYLHSLDALKARLAIEQTLFALRGKQGGRYPKPDEGSR